jgi:hypothetical protein
MTSFSFSATIPIGILLEPMIKLIQVSEDKTYFFNIADFSFFTGIAMHPRLTVKHGL